MRKCTLKKWKTLDLRGFRGIPQRDIAGPVGLVLAQREHNNATEEVVMRMAYLLVAGIVVAGALAAAGLDRKLGHASDATPAPEAASAAASAATAPPADEATEVLSGEVLETIDAGRYTYIRLGPKGSKGTWAAVPKGTFEVGSQVKVANAVAMKDFKSETLKRTFDTVYFGVIDSGSAASPHGADADGAHAASPHGGRADVPPDIKIGKIDRAKGAIGRTIEEVWAKKTDLVGKKVAVRGVVVKRTNGVLDKNWLHIKDGSGTAPKGDDDLVVTTKADVEVGQTVLIEGTVTADKDLGSGYRYPVLVEDATVTNESK
jgi:hypothetical protein